jgi:RHS repeat-associated protein
VTYGYDPRQMLESASGPWGALGFTHDPAGNRASRSLTPAGGPASVDAYAYAADSNRLTAIANPLAGTRSYSHDDAGNTTAELRALPLPDAWAYAYDKAGRLASVAVDGSAQGAYLYNALGQQVSRTAWPGPLEAVTLSVHDLNGNRIAEHDGSGAVLREYIWLDGRPLAVIEGGQVFWLSWDHILRPVMATDATGTVVWAARYLPFGGIDQVSVDTGALTQNLRFPGQWFQAETGLHQNWMRDYDPTTGRYLQADPLGLVDGASVYGYARQSPGRNTDPRGEFVPIVIGIVVGAGSDLALQLSLNGGQIQCVDWLQVGIGGALGALSGGYASGAMKGLRGIHRLTRGGAVQKYRKAHNIAGRGTEVHHAVVPAKGVNGPSIRHHMMNLKPIPRGVHKRIHGTYGGMERYGAVRRHLYGMPDHVLGAEGSLAAGGLAELLDGNRCGCGN